MSIGGYFPIFPLFLTPITILRGYSVPPKYLQEPVGANILREMERKADSVDWRRNTCQIWYVLFSASGFTEELKGVAAERGDVLLVDEQNN